HIGEAQGQQGPWKSSPKAMARLSMGKGSFRQMTKVGILGLGKMGSAFALNLLSKRNEVHVSSLVPLTSPVFYLGLGVFTIVGELLILASAVVSRETRGIDLESVRPSDIRRI